MTHRRFRFLLIGGALLVAACSDEVPTSSSVAPPPAVATVPSGTILTVVSGETSEPVAGARIVVGGRELTSDAVGRLALPSAFDRGSLLDVVHEGFLDRQTVLRGETETLITLWPNSSPTGLDEAFTFELVYDSVKGSGGRRLLRLAPSVREAYIRAAEPIRGDPKAMETVARAADTLTDVTDGAVVFRVTDDPPAGAVVFELVVDPGDPAIVDAVAAAKRRMSAWEILGGTVVYAALGTARTSTTLHELGHMFGLAHSPDPRDVMHRFRSSERRERFSDREALAMRLMLLRRAGNERPDNDRSVPGSALRAEEAWVSTVACEG